MRLRRRHSNFSIITLAGILLICGLARTGAAAEPVATFTLANGLEVVVLPDHRLPIVTHVVYYRAGSADDPPGQTGIAHFTEHLMFKGTKRYPTGQYDLIVTNAGGSNNAFTSNDKTYYYEQILKEGLPRIMDLDADRMTNLDFAPIEATHELKVVMEERRAYRNDPDSMLAESTGRALYEKGIRVYAHPVLGEPDETEALTLAAALSFHALNYSPDNAILIVAGDVTPQYVRQLAEATYGRIPAHAPQHRDRTWAKADTPCAEGRVVERRQRVTRDKASLYFLTPGALGMGVRTAAALRLLADLLQDQGTSPLWLELVGRSGLASELSVGHDLKLAAGEFSINLVAEQGVPASQLQTALQDSLGRLRVKGIPAAALSAAKRRWQANWLLSADDQLGLATHYGEQLSIGRTVAEIQREPQTIENVSLPEINAVLHDFLSNRCFVVANLEHSGEANESLDGQPSGHPTGMVH